MHDIVAAWLQSHPTRLPSPRDRDRAAQFCESPREQAAALGEAVMPTAEGIAMRTRAATATATAAESRNTSEEARPHIEEQAAEPTRTLRSALVSTASIATPVAGGDGDRAENHEVEEDDGDEDDDDDDVDDDDDDDDADEDEDENDDANYSSQVADFSYEDDAAYWDSLPPNLSMSALPSLTAPSSPDTHTQTLSNPTEMVPPTSGTIASTSRRNNTPSLPAAEMASVRGSTAARMFRSVFMSRAPHDFLANHFGHARSSYDHHRGPSQTRHSSQAIDLTVLSSDEDEANDASANDSDALLYPRLNRAQRRRLTARLTGTVRPRTGSGDEGDDDDDVEIVGTQPASASASSVGHTMRTPTAGGSAMNGRKRRRPGGAGDDGSRARGSSQFDTSGADSTAISMENNDVIEHFKKALKCSICLDVITDMTSTTCGHVYCGECVRLAIRVTGKCPLCQRPLRQKDVHGLYF